jgi:hypothetical protein
MKTIELDIFVDSDEEEVMKHLQILEAKHLIALRKTKSSVLPGNPLPIDELNRQIEKSEMSKSYNAQEAKKYLAL